MFKAISNLFGYLLNFLYVLVNNNFGFAIILFSILLRIILLPITIKQQKTMQKTSKLQGQLKALQLKYKNDQAKLQKETMELYKRENMSPFSGCLSAIAQIVIILSVFYLVSQPLTYMYHVNGSNNVNKEGYIVSKDGTLSEENDTIKTYNELNKIAIDKQYNRYREIRITHLVDDEYQKIKNDIDNPNIENKEELQKKLDSLDSLKINMDFLGLDLSKVPNENLGDFKVYIIPILYVISSFISIKISTNMQNNKKKDDKDEKEKNKDNEELDPTAQMSKSMSYIMPIMTVSIAFIAPLGLALYWFVSNVLMIAERFIIKKIVDNREAE